MKRRLSDWSLDVLIELVVATFVATGEKAQHAGAETREEIMILLNFILVGKILESKDGAINFGIMDE